MAKTLCKSHKPQYLNAFPSWKGRQPFRFFMMENLLEARRESDLPTNGAGPDEDVNVFLAGLLTGFLKGKPHSQVQSGAQVLFHPPGKTSSRRDRAEYYLANANHRLLYLGLLNRTDDLSRQPRPRAFTEEGFRAREISIGKICFAQAAHLLQGRGLVSRGCIEVYEKLSDHFEDYVQVLSVLAIRKLGLGAKLTTAGVQRLINGTSSDILDENPPPQADPGHPVMDHFLDLYSEYQKSPTPEGEQGLKLAARRAGINGEKYLSFNERRRT